MNMYVSCAHTRILCYLQAQRLLIHMYVHIFMSYVRTYEHIKRGQVLCVPRYIQRVICRSLFIYVGLTPFICTYPYILPQRRKKYMCVFLLTFVQNSIFCRLQVGLQKPFFTHPLNYLCEYMYLYVYLCMHIYYMYAYICIYIYTYAYVYI